MRSIKTERDLAGLALSLGAERVRGWSDAETALAANTAAVPRLVVEAARRQIERGRDPLGTALCVIRAPEERRPQGAIYTPRLIVKAMLRWAVATKRPVTRIVDPDAGSARFLVAAGRRFKDASLLGIDLDPLAAFIARGHIAAAGLESRAEILVGDFRKFAPPERVGNTLWIGNPPYVRHHLIEPAWKEWLARTAAERGSEASQLAGIHQRQRHLPVLFQQPTTGGTATASLDHIERKSPLLRYCPVSNQTLLCRVYPAIAN